MFSVPTQVSPRLPALTSTATAAATQTACARPTPAGHNSTVLGAAASATVSLSFSSNGWVLCVWQNEPGSNPNVR